jgi:uncharacterized protein YpbB
MNILSTLVNLESYIEHPEINQTETHHRISMLLRCDDELLNNYMNLAGERCTNLTAYFRTPYNPDYTTFEIVFDNNDDAYLVMRFSTAHAMLSMVAMLQQIPHTLLTTEWLVDVGFRSDC